MLFHFPEEIWLALEGVSFDLCYVSTKSNRQTVVEWAVT